MDLFKNGILHVTAEGKMGRPKENSSQYITEDIRIA